MLNKGTLVRVQTTNGGDIIAVLIEKYRPTYDVAVDINGSGQWAVIPSWRLKSVTPVAG